MKGEEDSYGILHIPGLEMRKNKRKFIIAGIIIFLAIGYLGFTGYQNAKVFDVPISEFKKQGTSVSGQTIQISGQVAPGSIEQKTGDLTLRFIVTEGGQSLPVIYRGVVPDTFKAGGPIVVKGKLNSSGVFEAETLMPKCPSKYVPTGKLSPSKDNGSWLT